MWIEEVKRADEDTILVIASHLPAEAAEAVLELAVGGRPKPRRFCVYKILGENVEGTQLRVYRHHASGEKYRISCCSSDGVRRRIIPSQERIEAIAYEADLEEVYNTERHLLYVPCTPPAIICWSPA